jgi:TolB-like protein
LNKKLSQKIITMQKMKHFLLILLISSITSVTTAQKSNTSAQITELTALIISKTSHLTNTSIGMINFTNTDNQVTPLGKLLAEEVSGELNLQNSNLTIIDRNRVNYWMEKENISVAQLSNPEAAERISEKAGITLVLMGSITPLDGFVRLNLKVINLKTGEVIAYERTELQQNKTFQALMDTPITTTSNEDITEKSTPQKVRNYNLPPKIEQETNVYNAKDASFLPHKTEINNLEFKLRACKRSANMVSIFFAITNKSSDITLKIDDKDVIIYSDEIDQLALTNFRFNRDISIYVERDLTTGVPIQLQLIFNNVPPDWVKIDRLVIDYYAGRNERIELQNIAIE